MTEIEWLEYLEIRKQQGVNVLQINILPQWDRCGTDRMLYPFATEDMLHFSFERILPEYFEHARKMCEQATIKGFRLALVVMWCNYVPNTWASRIAPYNVVPEAIMEPLIQKICDTFNVFDPVYLISGDTGFEEKSVVEHYKKITELLECYSKDTLKAFHIKGRYDGLPEELEKYADIYMYQSGHNPMAQDQAYTLGRSFYERKEKKPVINSEPCYEQMGYSHHAYGRFARTDTRRALWNSLLSGACAGITYGAHGIWNWQKAEMPTNPIAGEGFLPAMESKQALQFLGINDYSFAKKFFKDYEITEIIPLQEIIIDYQDYIHAGETRQGILFYVPTNAPFSAKVDFQGEIVLAIDLEHEDHPIMELQAEFKDGKVSIPMHDFCSDALVYIRKKR